MSGDEEAITIMGARIELVRLSRFHADGSVNTYLNIILVRACLYLGDREGYAETYGTRSSIPAEGIVISKRSEDAQ